MRIRLALLLLCVTGCTRGRVTPPAAPPPSRATPAITSVEHELRTVADLVNEHRKGIRCPTLAWNPVVARVAQAHSDDMVRRSYFTHNTPEGVTPGQRLSAAGVKWTRTAENIAAGQRTARAVFESWMTSPGHRHNIEDCALREHGVGLTRGPPSVAFGDVTYAWTHAFVTIR